MLDAIDTYETVVWFGIYVAFAVIVMSEGLIKEWARADGSLSEIFDARKAAPTLALGAAAGAVTFVLGGPLDPGLFDVVAGALVPILDNGRGVVRAVVTAVKDERDSGESTFDQARAGAGALGEEFDRETWQESADEVRDGMEGADGPTPDAAEEFSRAVEAEADRTGMSEAAEEAGAPIPFNAERDAPEGKLMPHTQTEGEYVDPDEDYSDEGNEGNEGKEGNENDPEPIGEAEDR